MLLNLVEKTEEVLAHEAFWSHVEQVELAIDGGAFSVGAFGVIERSVDEGGSDAIG